MKFLRTKLPITIIIILVLLGVDYYYADNINRLINQFVNKVQPCERPLTYSIGTIDPRFNLTKEELLSDLGTAEKIWETPVNKQLFEYSPTGDLKINFIYDYRQQSTEAMKKIGVVINDDQSSYDTLKAKYNSLNASYNTEKTKVDALVATYNTDKSAYEKDVSYWNGRGGAPKAEYAILDQKKTDLENQLTVINQEKDSLNQMVDTINSVGIVLNKLIVELKLQVNTYNTVGSSVGKTFDQGEYISNSNGTEIDIYQFDNTNQLVRVLAHEFGHAIGLDHINNPKAIMYYINEGINEKLTADDLSALKKECNIK